MEQDLFYPKLQMEVSQSRYSGIRAEQLLLSLGIVGQKGKLIANAQ